MNTFVSLLLFIVALGVLVTIHELGHFLFAKSFNVYCSDFSIGFGYKILKIVRDDPDLKKDSLFWIKSRNKKRETNFSIGIVPLGGYVAMLGEDDDETIKTSPELKGRSVEDLSYWKKLLVFFAGIMMNFILAWFIFFISASCFEQKKVEYINVVQVDNSTLANKSVTIDKDGTIPFEFTSPVVDSSGNKESYYGVYVNNLKGDTTELIYSINDPSVPVKISNNNNYYSLVFDTSSASLNNTDYSNCFKLVLAKNYSDSETAMYYPVLDEKNNYTFYTFSIGEAIDAIPFNFTKITNQDDKGVTSNVYLHLSLNNTAKLNKVGFGIYVYSYWNGLKSFGVASKNWLTSTDLIGRTLVKLFYDPNTWSSVGGPVAMFTQTTSILSDYPFYVYLNTWAVISVNLAIFNLLPFPGLDGWQILVCLIEWAVNGVKNAKNAKKKLATATSSLSNDAKEINVGNKENFLSRNWKFPPKIKNRISYLGLALLFLLAAIIFIKDLVGLF